MNKKKVAFIICSHHEAQLAEALFYIERQNIPDGFTCEVFVVNHAKGMTSGYQRAMEMSDAKYKIYLHEDVYIINKNAAMTLIKLFETYPEYGMLGVAGSQRIGAEGTISLKRGAWLGNFMGILRNAMENVRIWPKALENEDIAPVAALDGIFIATSEDILWRTDLFDGWHFYDLSQSMEFHKRGKSKVGCINTKTPWLIHCGDRQTVGLSYEKYRQIFINEYAETLKEYIL